MCIYIYIYTHTHTHIYIYTHTQTHTHSYILVLHCSRTQPNVIRGDPLKNSDFVVLWFLFLMLAALDSMLLYVWSNLFSGFGVIQSPLKIAEGWNKIYWPQIIEIWKIKMSQHLIVYKTHELNFCNCTFSICNRFSQLKRIL